MSLIIPTLSEVVASPASASLHKSVGLLRDKWDLRTCLVIWGLPFTRSSGLSIPTASCMSHILPDGESSPRMRPLLKISLSIYGPSVHLYGPSDRSSKLRPAQGRKRETLVSFFLNAHLHECSITCVQVPVETRKKLNHLKLKL